MATYKGIQGYTVQKLSEDPTASEAVGQLWYNSGTGKFKVAVAGAGAWATGGTAGSAVNLRGTAGTQTAAIAMGGTPYTANSETYDGTTWTETNDLVNSRTSVGASGTTAAAIAFAGYNGGDKDFCETWDGTCWTEGNNILSARQTPMSLGKTSTAAVCAGGQPPGSGQATSETYDGTSWTEGHNLNTARYEGSGTGTSTSGLVIGGWDGARSTKTES